MALSGAVQSASPGLLGFDSNTVIAAAVAQKFVDQGYSFCIRYLSRGAEAQSDLNAAEAEASAILVGAHGRAARP